MYELAAAARARPVKVKPMGARVLSRLLPVETRQGVLWLARTRNSPSVAFAPKYAEVVAVGDGGWQTRDLGNGRHKSVMVPPPTLKPGDVIMLPMYPGTAVPEYGITPEGEVVEIRDSRMSGLMMTDADQVVCVGVRE
jgi:hypothetical protein